jgi:hypothetical protein
LALFVLLENAEKRQLFFAENWRKSPKIVILTSTPEPDVIGEGLHEKGMRRPTVNETPIHARFAAPVM